MMLDRYKTLVFDCDGVLLNSNKIKTEAFYRAVLPFGECSARALVDYHVSNGGVSRYEKFSYFTENILDDSAAAEADLDRLLEDYARYVKKGMRACEVAQGLGALRKNTSDSCWMVVSGGDQVELRELFAERGLDAFFDGGVFGSPDNKDMILARELENGKLKFPAVFFGDSYYDYLASQRAGLDFVFVSGWSEFAQWKSVLDVQKVHVVSSLSDLL